jgi:cytochrome b
MNNTPRSTLVWDLPTRTFHWLLALSFAGAYVTAESERLRDVHMLLGYTTLGLVVFRLLWGVVGTRYARFTSFPLSPMAVVGYLKSLLARSPRHYFGHNPAGSWAIVGMLLLIVTLGATGWTQAIEIGPEWLEDLHEGLANAMLALAIVHVAAVLFSSALHRENLVRAMISGYKSGQGPAAAGTRWFVAVLLIGSIVAFWAGRIPAPRIEPGRSLVQAAMMQAAPGAAERDRRRHRENDDD